MTHFWLRAEQRLNERRTPLLPAGAAQLLAKGHAVTVEDARDRIVPTAEYAAVGCAIAAPGSWVTAPSDAVILGLKELPDDGTPLTHTHIMFGHAYKGQISGARLLDRFAAGGGTLLDLEYLNDAEGRRVAAFGYWAGFAGAAVTVMCAAAMRKGRACPPLKGWPDRTAMLAELRQDPPPAGTTALIIGAKGRVGQGVADLCAALRIDVTAWDMAETASGGPFPEILDHDLFFNCILARAGTPVFVPRDTGSQPRRLRLIGDIACDPDSAYNPVPLYDHATTWAAPTIRVHDDPPLDIMAIDNLPSLLPLESSEDFAGQLLPYLLDHGTDAVGVWSRALDLFARNLAQRAPNNR